MLQKEIKKRIIDGELFKLAKENELVVIDSQIKRGKIVVTIIKGNIEKSATEYGLRFVDSIAEVYKNYKIV